VVVGDWMASDVADIRDLDELEVYGSEAQTSVQIASYVFEVRSVCICIVPLCDICLTKVPEERWEKKKKNMYLYVE
jgi:cleavage and polyadenylation specificity factor subunit 1